MYKKINIDRPRVIFINEDYRLAGPHIYIFNMIKKDNFTGKPIFILPSNSNNELLSRFPDDEMELCLVKMKTLQLAWKSLASYFLNFLSDLIRIHNVFKSYECDYIYITGGSWQFKSVISSILARKSFIWHLNDSNMNIAVRLIFKFLSNFASKVIFASNKTKEYYLPLIKNKDIPTKVIQSSVDSKLFLLSPPNFADCNEIVFGTLANINPVKNLKRSIQIFNQINKQTDIKTSYLIGGPVHDSQANYFNSLKKLIRDLGCENINFIGNVEDPEFFYKRISIYLCTSDFESSPIAVWEAMASARVVISTPVGDVPNFIAHGSNGFLLKSDAEATDLSKLLSRPSYLEDISIGARELAKKTFTNERAASLHMSFFSQHNL